MLGVSTKKSRFPEFIFWEFQALFSQILWFLFENSEVLLELFRHPEDIVHTSKCRYPRCRCQRSLGPALRKQIPFRHLFALQAGSNDQKFSQPAHEIVKSII